MAKSADTKVTFVVTDDKQPMIKAQAGAKIELIEIGATYVDASSPKLVLGTLCGYSDTYCIALIETK